VFEGSPNVITHKFSFTIAIFFVFLCLSQSLPAQISFQAPMSLNMPNNGVGATIGDFNGDGILDIAGVTNVGNYPDNPARNFVFLGLGGGAFGPPTTLDPGGECWSAGELKAADVNNDGKLDLILAEGGSNNLCFGNVMSVQLGDGIGGFGTGIITHTGGSLLSFAVGDFNEDGKLDLAVRSADDHAILILLGNGDGTFTQGATLGPQYSENIAAVDLNGDGHLDLAATYADGVRVFFGDGTGNFSSPVLYPITNPSFFGIATGDFNGDGIPDLAVSNGSQGAVFVLLGTGGGQFSAPVAFPAGTNPQSEVIVADFDGDGHQDIAVGNCNANTVTVLKGDGHGGFAAPATFPSGQGSGCRLSSADLNDDGLPDLVTGSQAGMSVLLNSSPLPSFDTLTVSFSGNGTVTSTDNFIQCPGTCTHLYPPNTPVTLNATPNAGWIFSGWSGACSGTGPCNITMNQNLSVTATFSQVNYLLAVSISGSGTVTSTPSGINCPGVCGYSYQVNKLVTLTATPVQGWTFAGWSGACTGTGSCTVTMTQNLSVTATFTRNQGFYELTVSISGNGTVTSTDNNIDCPGTCSHTYASGAPVTLNATQAPGGTFLGWSGACSGSGSCNLTMTQNWGVTASFSVAQQALLLHSFGTLNDGQHPASNLIYFAGNLYGTTPTGGVYSNGRVFRLSPDGGETELYDFLGGTADGQNPQAGLIFDSSGNLYGTTSLGGMHDDGTVFQLSPNGVETVLYSFSGVDGQDPQAGLIFDASGKLYGTTASGGANGHGTAFELSPNPAGGWTESVLYNFGNGSADGMNPYAALVFDNSGNLYGTTVGGGTNGGGTVFELSPNPSGGWTESVLYNFGSGTDGKNPLAELVFDNSGNLYGTTSKGGANNNGGTAFELSPNGGGIWTETFYSFGSGTDGASPQAGLVFDNSGNLYGTTASGGAYGGGTVFELSLSNGRCCREGPVYSFGNGPSDAANPYAKLVFDNSGNLYGTTSYGGSYSGGTAFKSNVPQPLQFVATAPCRLVDTRNPDGTFGGPPLQGGVARSFPIPQQTPCDIPSTAQAYSLNVTLDPISGHSVGFVTVWPTGESQPNISIMNSWDGRFKANAAIVPAGTNGAVSVFSSDTTNVVLDIDGYFAPPSGSTLAFYPLPPCRVADTRNPNGPLGGPYLHAGAERDFPVLDAGACNIPDTAQAYSLNFTVVPRNDAVWVFTAWPFGQAPPDTSTLNAPTGTVVANAAITPAGTGGEIATLASADTDLAIDINGYFAPASSGGLSLYPVAPCRVLDTRKVRNGAPFTGELSPPVNVVGSGCGVANTAQAFVLNATIVPAGVPVYLLTLWPDGGQLPDVSTLNAWDGAVTSNMAIVPTTDGSIDAYAAGLTQLILDIFGYFAP
jgi:uncharacterized repeat protein (TIGR02543 family)